MGKQRVLRDRPCLPSCKALWEKAKNDHWVARGRSEKEASRRLEKLLLSAISNWQTKNEDSNVEDAGLFISEIRVDSGSMLKRLRTAPQGRAHRIRKRSNHVTIVLDSKNNDVQTN